MANTTAANNTAVGAAALDANTTGYSLTAVGKDAGAVCTTGSNSVFIGSSAGSNFTTGNTVVNIGAGTHGSAGDIDGTVVIGYNGADKGANTSFLIPTSGAYQGLSLIHI